MTDVFDRQNKKNMVTCLKSLLDFGVDMGKDHVMQGYPDSIR